MTQLMVGGGPHRPAARSGAGQVRDNGRILCLILGRNYRVGVESTGALSRAGPSTGRVHGTVLMGDEAPVDSIGTTLRLAQLRVTHQGYIVGVLTSNNERDVASGCASPEPHPDSAAAPSGTDRHPSLAPVESQRTCVGCRVGCPISGESGTFVVTRLGAAVSPASGILSDSASSARLGPSAASNRLAMPTAADIAARRKQRQLRKTHDPSHRTVNLWSTSSAGRIASQRQATRRQPKRPCSEKGGR